MSKLWRENRLYLELDSECLKTVLGPTTRLKVWEHQSPTSKDTLTITLCPSISELSDKSTVMTKHSSIIVYLVITFSLQMFKRVHLSTILDAIRSTNWNWRLDEVEAWIK